MARRSATNPRYQKGAQIGKTRRSAASVKPKREKGEAASSAGKKKLGNRGKPRLNPDTPEFKLWRRIWFGLLAAAMVFSIGALVFHGSGPVGTPLLVAAYVCLFGALYVDWVKIRKMRKEWLALQSSGGETSKDKG